jgi:predicted DNA-binding protein (UPF0251 family)
MDASAKHPLYTNMIPKARKKRKMQIVVIAAENIQILRLFFARF